MILDSVEIFRLSDLAVGSGVVNHWFTCNWLGICTEKVLGIIDSGECE